MKKPVQPRSEASAEAMVAAALDLLARGGLTAVTVAAVAERSGASNGSLYHRFGDRAGLLRAVHERGFGAMLHETGHAFAEADTEPDDERATLRLGAAALEIMAGHRALIRAFLVDLAGEPDVAARNAVYTADLRATVTGWLVRRLGATAPAADDAFRLLFSVAIAQALVAEDAPHPEALARAVVAVSRGG